MFPCLSSSSPTQVQLLYSDSSLGVRVEFLIKRLEILQTDPRSLARSYNIDRYLASAEHSRFDIVQDFSAFFPVEVITQMPLQSSGGSILRCSQRSM